MKKIVNVSVIAIIVVLLIGFSSYFTHFHGNVSNSSADWAAFSGYMSLFIGISSLCIVAVVSFLTYRINIESTRAASSAALAAKTSADIAIKNLEATERYYKQQTEPVIDFSDEPGTQNFGYATSWHLMNVSGAVARNVFIKFSSSNGWTRPILLFAIGKNGKIEIPWMQYAASIEVVFTNQDASVFYKFEMIHYRGRIIQISEFEFNAFIQNYLNSANVFLQFKQAINANGGPILNTHYQNYFANHWC